MSGLVFAFFYRMKTQLLPSKVEKVIPKCFCNPLISSSLIINYKVTSQVGVQWVQVCLFSAHKADGENSPL